MAQLKIKQFYNKILDFKFSTYIYHLRARLVIESYINKEYFTKLNMKKHFKYIINIILSIK